MKSDEANVPILWQPRTRAMMVAHLLVSGERELQERWQRRIEDIERAEAFEASADPDERRLMSSRSAWQLMKKSGITGAGLSLLTSTPWLYWLIPTYALGHGFGWLAALSYLLPIPIAVHVGRRLWERATLRGMIELGRSPTRAARLGTRLRAVVRSFWAGFGFGATLVFLQGIVSWFMTPAPTLAAELIYDASVACLLGAAFGAVSAFGAPLASQPEPTNALVPSE